MRVMTECSFFGHSPFKATQILMIVSCMLILCAGGQNFLSLALLRL